MKNFLAICALFMLVSCGFEVVDTGNRGILTNMGKVIGEPLPEGLQFYNPFTESITEMSVRETSQQFKLEAYSKDNQQIAVLVTITSAPVANKVNLIFKEFGEDFFNQVARPSITAGVKDILGQYTADNIVSERGKMQKQAFLYMQERLLTRHINVTGVEFNDIKFRLEYENAVEAKVVAIQRAEEAKNRTEEVREQKAQAILAAQGEAESIKIKAAALQQNGKLIELEAIKRWDGKLPQQMFGSGTVPFINVGK